MLARPQPAAEPTARAIVPGRARLAAAATCPAPLPAAAPANRQAAAPASQAAARDPDSATLQQTGRPGPPEPAGPAGPPERPSQPGRADLASPLAVAAWLAVAARLAARLPRARSGLAARARRRAARSAAWPVERSGTASATARLLRPLPGGSWPAGLAGVPLPRRPQGHRPPHRVPAYAAPCVLPPRLPGPPERILRGRRAPAGRRFSHGQHLRNHRPATSHTTPLPITKGRGQSRNTHRRQINRPDAHAG
jgi:hypothetical protein